MNYSQEYWEKCWEQHSSDQYETYLSEYYQKQDPIVELLKNRQVRTVCDAACGFGAYSLMLASNGFQVEGFDIAHASVEITRRLLQKYGIDASGFKIASVLNTGYQKTFDAVTARSVLDHLYAEDARKALDELMRIVKPGGIVVVSFDGLDEDDLESPHKIADDGSIVYCEGKKNGMVFHAFTDDELATWLNARSVILSYANERGERFYAIRKD